MSLPHHAHTVSPGEGRTANLGVAQMRVLAAGKDTTDGAFTLAEFTGGPGPWTVPHIHQAMEESFYVLDGAFTFAVGEQEIAAGPGAYVLVPRGTRHGITAGPKAAGSSPSWCPAAWKRCSSNSPTCRRTPSPTRPCEPRSPPGTTRFPPEAP